MNNIFENNFVWGKLRESSDLTRDLITIYNKDFFEKFVGYFETKPHPLDLVETTLDTARAYIHAWQEKLANKSDFGTFTGRHILKAGIAARDLEYSLRQLSKSDLAAFILKWDLENIANGKSIKTDQIFDYINRQYGPAEPLEIYRIFADAIARAANGLIPLPDKEETESQYIARGDAFSKEFQSDKWKKISELPAHHALQQAAVAFKPLWEQHSNRLYYKGRYDGTKGGFYSPPASALQFLIRKIDPEPHIAAYLQDADNFFLMCKSDDDAKELHIILRKLLEQHPAGPLKVKNNYNAIKPNAPFEFLGYWFEPANGDLNIKWCENACKKAKMQRAEVYDLLRSKLSPKKKAHAVNRLFDKQQGLIAGYKEWTGGKFYLRKKMRKLVHEAEANGVPPQLLKANLIKFIS